MNSENRYISTLHENYNAMLQWVVAMQHGHSMSNYLSNNGYHSVAVYGMNDIGNCIVREFIKNDHIDLLYAIDQGEPKLYFDVDCYRLDALPEEKPDIIVVALPYLYDEIKEEIEEMSGCKTISVTEIVYEMDK